MESESNTVAILFVDICGSTRLYEAEGDAVAYDLNERSLQLLSKLTERHEGTVIRQQGDGQLSIFPSADQALWAGIGMQATHDELPIKIRIGVHYGEALSGVGGDIYGDAVNVAARVLALAREGETLLTRQVYEKLSTPLRLGVQELDSTNVRGRNEPVTVYIVRNDHDAQSTTLARPDDPTPKSPGTTLEVRHGSDTQVLGRGLRVLVVGRDRSCDLTVLGPLASRRHATLSVERDRYVLTDHSINGTYFTDDTGEVMYLKRESASLGSHGAIGLGAPPDSDQDTVIQYRRIDAR